MATKNSINSIASASEVNILDGATLSTTELNYVDGVTSDIQTQINSKATASGALTQFIGNGNWKVWYSDGSGDAIELALGADGTFLKSNGATAAPTFATPAGSGDMVLASAQTNSGIKTFLDTTMKLRNVANTFDGYFVNTNTADRIYTLKDASGTLAFTSDITGTNSGTNTGDQTSIVGITGTKAQFDTAVTDGNFLYVGDITQYTDELAQDAVGAMVSTAFTYTDVTPLLALTSRTIGGVAYDGTANITVATATGGFTVSGGDLALGANSLTLTGSLAATGARVTKGWFTDVESTNMPTVGGTAILTSLTAPQFTTIEIGHATDTTLSRSSAGVLAVEGVVIPSISSTNTLTNKRIQPRTASSTTSASLTPDVSTANVYFRTTQTEALTIGAPTGTPVIGETIMIYIDSVAGQTLTINSTYKAFGAAFPASTTAGKTFMMSCQYNGTDWKTLWAQAQ